MSPGVPRSLQGTRLQGNHLQVSPPESPGVPRSLQGTCLQVSPGVCSSDVIGWWSPAGLPAAPHTVSASLSSAHSVWVLLEGFGQRSFSGRQLGVWVPAEGIVGNVVSAQGDRLQLHQSEQTEEETQDSNTVTGFLRLMTATSSSSSSTNTTRVSAQRLSQEEGIKVRCDSSVGAAAGASTRLNEAAQKEIITPENTECVCVFRV